MVQLLRPAYLVRNRQTADPAMLKYTDIYRLHVLWLYMQITDKWLIPILSVCLGHATPIKATGVVSFSSFLVV